MVTIARRSPITGRVNQMTLNISENEYRFAQAQMARGVLLQDAFHMLDADEREFIKTGVTAAEWDTLFMEGDG